MNLELANLNSKFMLSPHILQFKLYVRLCHERAQSRDGKTKEERKWTGNGKVPGSWKPGSHSDSVVRLSPSSHTWRRISSEC